MVKLLHTADIHLDAPLKSLALRDDDLRDAVRAATRGALERIVAAALEHEVAAVLIAGDLYDGAARSARTAAFLGAQLDRLREAGIAVFYIKGNHDAENPVTGEVALPDNVHVFGGRGGRVQLAGHDVWIHGVSFSGRHAPENLLPKFAAPVAGAVNVALLHTSLAGAAGHDTYAPCSVAELREAGFDYWALGHVHRRQVHGEAPWIVMPGTPQGRDIGEPGPKSATLIEIGGGRIAVTEIPTSGVEFATLDISAEGIDDDDALRARLRADLRAAADALVSDAGILRLRLTGATPRRWQLERDRDVWAALAADVARETGRLWVESTELALSDPPEAGPEGGAVAELAALMAAIAREPAFAAAAEARLAEVLGELPPQARAALAPDADAQTALARSAAAAGARRLRARMKGAAE